MSQIQHALARLRDICHGEPGEASWSRLQQILENINDRNDLEVALAYAAPLLERWPWQQRRLSPKRARRLLEGGEEASWGLTRQVQVTEAGVAQVARLVALPALGGPVGLELHLSVMEEREQVAALEALAGSWWARRAVTLRVHNSRLVDAGLAALLSRPWPLLEELSLERNLLTGLSGLPAGALPALRALDLSNNVQMEELAGGLEAAALTRLETLNVQGLWRQAQAERLIGLLGSPSLPAFEHLNLSDARLVPDALQERWSRGQPQLPAALAMAAPLQRVARDLVARGALAQVRHLTLKEVDAALQDEALAVLCASAAMPSLVTLDVEGCSPLGLSLILGAPWRGQLKALTLRGVEGRRLGDAQGAALGAAEGLDGLLALSLYEQGLGAEGASALLGGAGLAGLKALDLWGNPLGVEGARWLAGDARVAKLRLVALDVFRQGEGAIEALSGCGPARVRARSMFQPLDHIGDALREIAPPGFAAMAQLNYGWLDRLHLSLEELRAVLAWCAGQLAMASLRFGPSAWPPGAAQALMELRIPPQSLTFQGMEGFDEALASLLSGRCGEALYSLNLSDVLLGARGFEALLSWSAPSLRYLHINQGCGLGEAQHEAIRARFAPRCYIY